MSLAERIERLYRDSSKQPGKEHFEAFAELKQGLNSGAIRSAESVAAASSPTGWRVNAWVKMGILLGFRIGAVEEMSVGSLPFFDKNTYPVKSFSAGSGVRIVPGGSSIRDGAYLAKGVVCMPPMFVNVGAYIDEGTMVDSHALVGSCAQIGKRVHLSAASQIGGVLEPVGALPVVVEDDVLIGGNCGVYEGTIVKERAVLGSGTILTGSTPVYDLVRGEVYRKTDDAPLVIPAGAVVVPGSRAVASGKGKDWNISIYTPVIVKYRDSKTDTSVKLEDFLR